MAHRHIRTLYILHRRESRLKVPPRFKQITMRQHDKLVDKLHLSRKCDIMARRDCATRTLLNGYVIRASMIFRETLQWC